MKSIIYSFVIIIVLPFISNAQLNLEWESFWNSQYSNYDVAFHMNIDSDGNIYIAGTSASGNGIDYHDIAVVKYSPDGTELWSERFDIGWSDQVIGIYFDASENIILGVTGADSSIYHPSFMLLKYDKDGNMIYGNKFWAYYPGQTGNLTGLADKLYRDNYGQLVIGGVDWLVKMHPDGYLISSYAVPLTDSLDWYGRQTHLDESRSELSVPVSAIDYGSSTYSGGLVKLNSDGTPKWITTFMSNKQAQPGGTGVLVSNDGATYLGFYSTIWHPDVQEYQADQHLLKFDTGGQVLWDKTLESNVGNIYVTRIWDMVFDGYGNVIVTGQINSKFFAAKYSTAGERFLFIQESDTTLIQGLKILPASGYDFYVSVHDMAGNVHLIKYDNFGNQLSKIILQGSGAYYPLFIYDMMYDESDNIMLAGGIYNSSEGYNFASMKISDSSTDVKDGVNTPTDFNLFQNYPNPFNPTTKIKFAIGSRSPLEKGNRGVLTRLTIYDILGNKVKTLVNEIKEPGTYEVEFNGSNLSSGIYYCRMNCGSFTQTIKLALLK